MNDVYTDNRIFYWSLIFSLIVHLLVVTYLTFSKHNVFRKSLKQIEVTYQVITPKSTKDHVPPSRESNFIKEVEPVKKVEVLEKKQGGVLPFLEKKMKDFSKLGGKFNLDKKKSPRITSKDLHSKVTISEFGMKKGKDKGPDEKGEGKPYKEYELNIRNRIYDAIYKNFDNTKITSSGNVYLTFLVSSSGKILEIKIMGDRTEATSYMKSHSVRTLKSVLLPPFTSDMKLPEATYNIRIEFRFQE